MVDTKKLAETATRLNEASDSINTTLQKVQDKLNSLNIGLVVWGCTLEEDDLHKVEGYYDDGVKSIAVELGYAKTENGWGLAYRERQYEWELDSYNEREEKSSYDIESPKLLLKASREIRIKAVRELQTLIDMIKAEAERAIKDIEKAKQLADEL